MGRRGGEAADGERNPKIPSPCIDTTKAAEVGEEGELRGVPIARLMKRKQSENLDGRVG